MLCGICGQRMKSGKFVINTHSAARSYSSVSWYEGNNLVAETNTDKTTGFFCQNCGIIMGVFFGARQVGFTSDYSQNLDDNIDSLPKKICPDCGTKLDIDYPRCPECGYLF